MSRQELAADGRTELVYSYDEMRVRQTTSRFDEADFYCPSCRCRKCGWVDEANGHDESCDDSACRCHDEEPDPRYLEPYFSDPDGA